MVGYFLAYFVDSWTGAGLYDQQNSFLGKLALHLVVFAILIFRCAERLLQFCMPMACLCTRLPGLMTSGPCPGLCQCFPFHLTACAGPHPMQSAHPMQGAARTRALKGVACACALLCRSTDSLASLKNLLDEATFYDKQWAANWQNQPRPEERE
jgi:hypothetical protein